MTTTFHIKESEIDTNFMTALKSMFKNRTLTMVVEAEEMDETEYLLSNPINKKRLLDSIKSIENGDNLIETNLEDLKAQYHA